MPVCYVNKTPFSLFAIYKNVQLCSYNRCMKPSISLACKKYPCFSPVKAKETKKEIKQKTLSFIKLKQTFPNNSDFKRLS